MHMKYLLLLLSSLLMSQNIDCINYCQENVSAYNKSSKICKEICTSGCPNGYCDLTELKCMCSKAFRMVNNKCELGCSKPCPQNAKCVGIEKCECNDGYRMENNKCMAVCSPACGENRFCLVPGVCECKGGYIENAEKQCEPLCTPACKENAKCKEPGTCECERGYEKKGSKCLPVCSKPCGKYMVCGGPESCQCITDYIKNALGICEPVCVPACKADSNCVAPNICECNVGFHRDTNNTCKKECWVDMDLIFTSIRLACHSSQTMYYIIYATTLAVILCVTIIVFAIIYRCFKCLCTQKEPIYSVNDHFIVAYQPTLRSECETSDNEQHIAAASRSCCHMSPPPYS